MIRVFPKIGVSRNGWFIMENPITYLTMILLIVDPAPKSLLLWGMGFSPCTFQTPMVYGMVRFYNQEKCVWKKLCYLILETPNKRCVFFTFSKGRYHNRPPHRRKLEASFFRVFLLCPWKFRHPTCVRFRGVFTSVESTEINGEPRHLPTGGERGGISRPNITLPETNSKSTWDFWPPGSSGIPNLETIIFFSSANC